VVIRLERRFKLRYGRVMAVYVMAYTLGRGWIEYLRIDDVQLEHVLGLRFNVWTSIVLFTAAAIYFVISTKRHPGREESIFRDEHDLADSDGETAVADEADEADVTTDEVSEDDEASSADGSDPAETPGGQDDSGAETPVSGKVSTED
jgi:hypothetical protein